MKQLVNHTNGIDADTLMPAREFGPNAVQSYIDALARAGTLFAPDELLHYTNPDFTIAGAHHRDPFRKEFQPHARGGDLRAHRHGPIGHVRHPGDPPPHRASGRIQAPDGEMTAARACSWLPVSAAPAGATPIVNVGGPHCVRPYAPGGRRRARTATRVLSARALPGDAHARPSISRRPTRRPIGPGLVPAVLSAARRAGGTAAGRREAPPG